MAQNNAYRENGYNDREDYLSCIAEDYGLDLEQVVRPLADLLWVQRRLRWTDICIGGRGIQMTSWEVSLL